MGAHLSIHSYAVAGVLLGGSVLCSLFFVPKRGGVMGKLLLTFFVTFPFIVGGCSYNIKYVNFLEPPILPSKEPVRIVSGSLGDIPHLEEMRSLPHITARENVRLEAEINQEITKQLGSDDYCIIGHMDGKGNTDVDINKLKMEMAKRAGQNGGTVLFVHYEGVQEQPFIYSTPGYSTTAYRGNANTYATGNYAQTNIQGTANTSYVPSQTYSGMMYSPFAQAFVLVYCPGFGEYYPRLKNLSEKELADFDAKRATLDLKSLTFVERNAKLKSILDEIEHEQSRVKKTTTSQP
jgi:hypothetical protein